MPESQPSEEGPVQARSRPAPIPVEALSKACGRAPLFHRTPTSWTSNASTASARCSSTWLLAPSSSGGIFDYERKSLRLREVDAALENPAIWNEPKRAQEMGREKKALETVVGTIDHLKSHLADNAELYEMVKAEQDVSSLQAIEADAALEPAGV